MPVITYFLIGIIVLTSIQGFKSQDFAYKLSFSPYLAKHESQAWRFFTHIFVHADWGHLFFNMFSFYSLGSYMEMSLKYIYGPSLGSIHFIILFLAGGLFATLWPYVRNQDNVQYLSLGASGAVSAVIFAFVMWSPNETLIIFVIPMKAYIFGPLYLAFEYFAFRRGKGNIAHDAHIGGAVFGIVYILIINIDKGKEFLNQIFN
jgi:membrane associated rhomboid family serine protease